MTAAGTPSTARPMDGPLLSRLYQMGIVKRDGEINVENMRLFTRIYAAQFYYNLCDSYAKSTVGTVLASFDELSGRMDYKGIYLFLSLQYDQLRKPLPDPVWWLMGSPKALKIFSIGFVESLTEVFREEESYVQADDRNAQL